MDRKCWPAAHTRWHALASVQKAKCLVEDLRRRIRKNPQLSPSVRPSHFEHEAHHQRSDAPPNVLGYNPEIIDQHPSIALREGKECDYLAAKHHDFEAVI